MKFLLKRLMRRLLSAGVVRSGLTYFFLKTKEFILKNAQAHPWGARPRAPALGRFQNKFFCFQKKISESLSLQCLYGGVGVEGTEFRNISGVWALLFRLNLTRRANVFLNH